MKNENKLIKKGFTFSLAKESLKWKNNGKFNKEIEL